MQELCLSDLMKQSHFREANSRLTCQEVFLPGALLEYFLQYFE
jgi:hypothetical protein